jgi:hypothetical protein
MQNEKTVREKFDELYKRELDKKKKEFLSCSHENCKHNFKHRIKGYSKVGFCSCGEVLNKTKDGIFVCNDEQTAKRCKQYSCSKL